MKIKNISITLSILFTLCAIAIAQTPKESFNEANKLYAKGEWQQAITIYNQLLENAQVAPELYYNLGNANLKMQNIGLARLNFERALRLSPRDADIKYNLEFTKKLCGESEQGLIEQALFFIPNLFTLNELAIICSAIFVFLSGAVIAFVFLRNIKLLWVGVAIFCVLVIFSLFLGIKINNEKLKHIAIVIKNPAEIRNGPSTTNSVGFTLPEGRSVLLLGTSDAWVAVGLKEGYKGWVENEFVEEI